MRSFWRVGIWMGRGRPLEREIRVLEDGIARLGVMLEDGEADAREVALPLARLVRALSMALRTQQGMVARDAEVVEAAMRRVVKKSRESR